MLAQITWIMAADSLRFVNGKPPMLTVSLSAVLRKLVPLKYLGDLNERRPRPPEQTSTGFSSLSLAGCVRVVVESIACINSLEHRDL